MRVRVGMWLGAALALLGGAAPVAAQVVLWDQRDQVSGDGIPDQDFEAELDEFDSQAADDFVVDWPDGWRVEGIFTVGDQSLERTAGSVDVAIHADVGGRPAAGAMPGCQADELVPTDEDDGSFELRLPELCDLPPGRYWLVLQTNQDFDPDGQHFWSSRLATRGLPALWRNPNDGFDTGCRDWGTLAACETGGSFPDLLFALEGTLLDPPPVVVGDVETLVPAGVSPAIAVGSAGIWAAAWRRGDRVEFRRFDDLDQPLGPAIQAFRGASAGAPQVGVDELGGVAVVWERPAGGVQARFFDEDGNPTRGVFQVVAVGRSPGVARGPDGLTAVVWQEGEGGIFARLYDFDGNPLSSSIAVDAAAAGRAPAVAMGRDGVWTVTWRGVDNNLLVRSFGPTGIGLGAEAVVAALVDPAVQPAVAARGGRELALVWAADGEILARSWEAGVGPSGTNEEMVIAAVGGTALPITRLVASGNTFGEVVVSWQIDTGANARLFTRFLAVDGSLLGSALDLGFGRDDVAVALDPAGQARLVAQRSSGDLVAQRLLIRPGECEGGLQVCLGGADGERFAVRVAWKAFDGRMGLGIPQRLTEDTGWFWFFAPENVEVVLKVLDGRTLNDSFWVFYAALSNVEFTISVVDRETGLAAVYHNLEGQFASVGDTEAIPLDLSAASVVIEPEEVLANLGMVELGPLGPATKAGPCVAGTEVLCLIDGRFDLRTTWRDFEGTTGVGKATLLAGQTTGYFWFFNSNNVEIVVKVLDGRVLNGRYWVFVAALSNVEFSLIVRDLETGAEVVYSNPEGRFASFADTSAF